MLYAFSTKRAGAMTLAGDYLDLRALYEAIHAVRPELSEAGAEGVVLGLAYDVRKAKEGSRESVKTQSHLSKGTVYLGVKLPLLRAVLQLAYLRQYLADYPTSPHIIEKQKRNLKNAADFEAHLKASGKNELAAMLKPPEVRRLTMGDRASLLQFEAALVGVLEEVGVEDGESFLRSVEEAVSQWHDEPDGMLTDTLDYHFLYVTTTKLKRVAFLKGLPAAIRPRSKFWQQVQRDRLAVAREAGVAESQVSVTWPEEDPKW